MNGRVCLRQIRIHWDSALNMMANSGKCSAEIYSSFTVEGSRVTIYIVSGIANLNHEVIWQLNIRNMKTSMMKHTVTIFPLSRDHHKIRSKTHYFAVTIVNHMKQTRKYRSMMRGVLWQGARLTNAHRPMLLLSFRMSFKDFSTHFQRLEICHLGPEALEGEERSIWVSQLMQGAWKKKVNAGGCRNYPGKWPHPPL